MSIHSVDHKQDIEVAHVNSAVQNVSRNFNVNAKYVPARFPRGHSNYGFLKAPSTRVILFFFFPFS